MESSDENFVYPEKFDDVLAKRFKEEIDTIQKTVPEQEDGENEPWDKINWINILINLSAMAIILILYLVFPPSILLTISLTTISFLTTVITAREYLLNFYHNLRNRNFTNMATTISFGMLLSLAHMLYHAISMPLASSFSMIFMSYIMPVMLITFINGMDEIKRLVFNTSKKMSLKGIENLFPQMSKSYLCYQLEEEDFAFVSKWLNIDFKIDSIEPDKLEELKEFLSSKTPDCEKEKKLLREGMIVEVKRGECFPVDCILMDENIIVDASLLTGEPRQVKKLGDKIPAGAINFDKTVKVYAINNSYNSTINHILLPANREKKAAATSPPDLLISIPLFSFYVLVQP